MEHINPYNRKDNEILFQWIRRGWVGRKVHMKGAEFVQQSRGERIGIMVSLGPGNVGWSLLSPKEKKFNVNWKKSFQIALGRAKKNLRYGSNSKDMGFPFLIIKDLERFLTRTRRIKNWYSLNTIPKWDTFPTVPKSMKLVEVTEEDSEPSYDPNYQQTLYTNIVDDVEYPFGYVDKG